MSIPVIHDNGGHVDDLLSCILLWLAPEVDLQVVGITNSDCYYDQAYEAMVKMATYLDLEGAEIALSEVPMKNPFPDNWRKESYIISELPLFGEIDLKKPYQQGLGRKSQVAYADCLNHTKTPVTIVTTAPPTNVAPVLKENPELRNKVERLVMMAGAFNAPGNVAEDGHDGSAEWNVYADPDAFKTILETKIPLRLIPLDVTNKFPVTKEFLKKLDDQAEKYKASKLAAKLWSLVKGFEYYFWNTVTAAAVIKPELFTYKELKIDVVTSGKSQGRTSTGMFTGRKAEVAIDVQVEAFEDLLLSIFRLR